MNISQSTQLNRKLRPVLFLIIIPLLLALSPGANAGHPVIKSVDINGVMIDGYDVVAYYTMADAVKGSEGISADWLGGKWLFTNDEHRDLFLADPANYIPQYGGYCSSAPRLAKHSDIDPRAWQVVDNKLYLFYDTGTAERWISDFFGKEVAAERKWGKAKAGLQLQ